MSIDDRIAPVVVLVRACEGNLIAHSRDLPGLRLWGRNEAELCDRIVAGIKLMFRLNRGIDVEVKIAADPQTLEAPKTLSVRNDFLVAAAA